LLRKRQVYAGRKFAEEQDEERCTYKAPYIEEQTLEDNFIESAAKIRFSREMTDSEKISTVMKG
jgi:hypothetical protein